MPLDADRVVELPWAAARVSETRPRRVLDVASPKLLACWLAESTPSEVTAIDLWDAEIARWQTLVAAVDPAHRRFRRLALEVADGTRLPYADASFDAAVSISVIEHIPGEGDVAAILELARVLRPGGRLVLTIPFGAAAEDVRVQHDLYGQRYEGTPLFFYRRYAPDTVAARLLGSGGFELVEQTYWHKHGVQPAEVGLHRLLPAPLYRLIPARSELGRVLSPVLTMIGSRGLVPGSPEHPGTDGVLGLLLRRQS